MSDLYDEITEELRVDRAKQFLKQNYKNLIGAVIALLVVTALSSFWQEKHQEAKGRATAELLKVLDTGNADDLQKLADKAPADHAALADMVLAGQYVAQGKTDQALTVYQKVATSHAPSFWRDLARFNQATLQSNKGQLQDAEKTLAPLLSRGNVFRPSALELQAALEAKQGNNQKAFENYAELSTLTDADEATRDRARLLMRYYQP